MTLPSPSTPARTAGIWCDHCRSRYISYTFPVETRAQANQALRARAYNEGWLVTDEQDLCPTCVHGTTKDLP